MRVRQRGFTLVELAVVVAIIGVLCAIAIPTFVAIMNKSKSVEASLALDKIVKNIRAYHTEKRALPPASNLMPDTAACDHPSGKTPATQPSQWYADPGWAAIEFHLAEPGYYQYSWTKNTDTDGFAQAISDLDCDGVPGMLVFDVSIVTGDVFRVVSSDVTD